MLKRLLVLLVPLGLLTVACTEKDDSTVTAETRFNDADVAFAQGMIPHHEQAIEMAAMAPTRASFDQVKTLAEAIRGAQQPEIERMRGWLAEWGRPETPDVHGDVHGGEGMMTEEETTRLSQASGEAFDRLFLQLMIRHHKGAIKMAEDELAGGRNSDAKALAGTIRDAQQREVTDMEALLVTLGG